MLCGVLSVEPDTDGVGCGEVGEVHGFGFWGVGAVEGVGEIGWSGPSFVGGGDERVVVGLLFVSGRKNGSSGGVFFGDAELSAARGKDVGEG